MAALCRRRMTVAYDGTDFSGWQLQPGRRTVQGCLEQALERTLGSRVRVFGAGRTDAGVHALGQVAHFDAPEALRPERLLAALNSRLPPDVRVRELAEAAPGFHALHSARDKTYVYQLHLASRRDGPRVELPPLRRRTFHAIPGGADVAAMRAAARLLVGRRDFTALSKVMDSGRSPIKTLHTLRVLRIPHGLRVVATADGFLYGMMRLLCGLLVQVGTGRRRPQDVPALLAAGDRSRAPPSLPARGLLLLRVRYSGGPDGLLSWAP
ncbi:MAG TPA: tRNA pseudouridine(38-40) synthase TruA [Planctomycetota bacterium]|nr:tRNA pseudouridine(38-40) synthase TruA [Planctomycetota bacterium]